MGRTRAGRTDEDGAQLLGGCLAPDSVLCSLLERVNLVVQLRDKALEVLELVGRCHGGGWRRRADTGDAGHLESRRGSEPSKWLIIERR